MVNRIFATPFGKELEVDRREVCRKAKKIGFGKHVSDVSRIEKKHLGTNCRANPREWAKGGNNLRIEQT